MGHRNHYSGYGRRNDKYDKEQLTDDIIVDMFKKAMESEGDETWFSHYIFEEKFGKTWGNKGYYSDVIYPLNEYKCLHLLGETAFGDWAFENDVTKGLIEREKGDYFSDNDFIVKVEDVIKYFKTKFSPEFIIQELDKIDIPIWKKSMHYEMMIENLKTNEREGYDQLWHAIKQLFGVLVLSSDFEIMTFVDKEMFILSLVIDSFKWNKYILLSEN